MAPNYVDMHVPTPDGNRMMSKLEAADEGRSFWPFIASVVISPDEASMRLQLAEIRSSGCRHVEVEWPFTLPAPTSTEILRFCAALEENRLQLASVHLYGGNRSQGDDGLACKPTKRAVFDASLPAIAEIAARSGCTKFVCPYGQPDPSDPASVTHLAAADSVAGLAHLVAEYGGEVLLQPAGRSAPGNNPLRTVEDVCAVVDGLLRPLGAENVRLSLSQSSLRHDGVDVLGVVRRFGTRVGRFGVVEDPGSIAFEAIAASVSTAGYSGMVTVDWSRYLCGRQVPPIDGSMPPDARSRLRLGSLHQ
ncbi:sugar phosphate isomerase/epimerase family protein [Rhodococcus globerulus]|uniref:Xylose isomerase-like TIM barrel domain-containing protein n=1 Tax=Rhodococcus globerulus TaxID=33008 RepID=A0ABU4C3L5_RHOGO|nr:hypothetical protein [Rhodococcus globerulus]MDV6270851.1 hypothetical protein [Rhodococcus globerulus]